MIEDLVFKGKSLNECLNKAANFFGVDSEKIKYEFVEETPEEEVWIQLTENPIMAQRAGQNAPAPRDDAQPQVRASRGPRRDGDGNYQRDARDSRHQSEHRQSGPRQGGQRDRGPRQGGPRQGGPRQGRPQSGGQRGPRNQGGPRGGRQGGNFGRNDNRGRKNHGPKQDYNHSAGFNDAPPARGPRRDNWKRSEQDLSNLSPVEREIHTFVTNMLDKLRLRAEVLPTQDQTRLILNVDGPDRNILLNRKGEALVAIQYLVNKIFMGRDDVQQPVYVDSMGYRVARDEELQEIAITSAEKVRRSGKEYSLSPMNPYERRQIHVTLKDEDGVETVSRGNGYIKRVSIVPSQN